MYYTTNIIIVKALGKKCQTEDTLRKLDTAINARTNRELN